MYIISSNFRYKMHSADGCWESGDSGKSSPYIICILPAMYHMIHFLTLSFLCLIHCASKLVPSVSRLQILFAFAFY